MTQADNAYRKVNEKIAGTSSSKLEKTAVDEALLTQDEWSKNEPIVPVQVEAHPERIIERPDGMRHHDWVLVFKRAHVEAMRQGYACIRCWVWQDEPFPWHCRHCRYEMKKLQAEDFRNEFVGERWVGSQLDLRDEQDRLTDWADKDRLEKGERIAGVSVPIWLPGMR